MSAVPTTVGTTSYAEGGSGGTASDLTREAGNAFVRLALPLFCGLVVTLAGLRPAGYDLQLYQRMARTALAGGNPYADPYADFPPLKMWLLTMVQRMGWWDILQFLLAVVLGLLLCVFLVRRYRHDEVARWLGLVSFLGPGVIFASWYQMWEDKSVYVIILLTLLLVLPPRVMHARHGVATSVVAGLLQGYGGGGAFLLPVLLWNASWRTRSLGVIGFAATLLVTHVPYVPAWLSGYARRAARMHTVLPDHASLWQLPFHLWGMYQPSWPTAATLGVVVAAWLLFSRGNLPQEEALVLCAAAVLLLGPDASYDRVLAGFLPLLWLQLDRHAMTMTVVALLGALSLRLAPEPWTPLAALFWLPPLICLVGTFRAQGRPPAPADGARGIG